MLQTARSAGIDFGSPYSNCPVLPRQGWPGSATRHRLCWPV